MAIKNEGGFEIHGWLQENFDDYEDLIDNYVLDRATLYSMRHYTPEMIKQLDKIEPDKLKKTRINLLIESELKNYPGIKIKQLILLSRDDLKESVTWIPNYEYEINGFDTRVMFAPANIALLGWCLWNLPVYVVLHAPGKNQEIYDAKIEAEAIDKTMHDIKNKIIHQHRTGAKHYEDKLDQEMRDRLQTEKKYHHLLKEIETRAPRDIIADYNRIERNAYKKHPDINWKLVIIAIFVFFLIGLSIYGIFMFNNFTSNLQGTTNSTGGT